MEFKKRMNLEEINSFYINKANSQYKTNIRVLAKEKKNMSLKDLSNALGYEDRYVSNSFNKNTTIVSNNLLHKISLFLECSMLDINRNMWKSP